MKTRAAPTGSSFLRRSARARSSRSSGFALALGGTDSLGRSGTMLAVAEAAVATGAGAAAGADGCPGSVVARAAGIDACERTRSTPPPTALYEPGVRGRAGCGDAGAGGIGGWEGGAALDVGSAPWVASVTWVASASARCWPRSVSRDPPDASHSRSSVSSASISSASSSLGGPGISVPPRGTSGAVPNMTVFAGTAPEPGCVRCAGIGGDVGRRIGGGARRPGPGCDLPGGAGGAGSEGFAHGAPEERGGRIRGSAGGLRGAGGAEPAGGSA